MWSPIAQPVVGIECDQAVVSVRKDTLRLGAADDLHPARSTARCWLCQTISRRGILCVANLCVGRKPPNLIFRHGKTGSLWKCSAHPLSAIGELPYMITLSPYGFYWFPAFQERDKSEHVAPRSFPNSRPRRALARPGCRCPYRSVLNATSCPGIGAEPAGTRAFAGRRYSYP